MAKSDKDKEEKKAPLEGSDPPWAKKAPKPEPEEDEDEEDEEEDDDDDDDDEPPPAKAAPEKKASTKPVAEEEDDDDEDEDEEDDDEEEEDDEEEDEEPPPPPRSKRDAKPSAKKPAPAPARGRARPAPKRPAPAAPDDGLPAWLPWAVMIGLISLGVMGALGVFSKKPGAETAADSPATTAEAAAAPDQISAQHLLVQYKGSMRAAPSVERTKEQAKARAEEALKKAKGGGNFDALVGEYSDEPGAAQRKGQLGKFSRQMMVKEFSDAAFKLKVGELSGIVETSFGFHVIKRSE